MPRVEPDGCRGRRVDGMNRSNCIPTTYVELLVNRRVFVRDVLPRVARQHRLHGELHHGGKGGATCRRMPRKVSRKKLTRQDRGLTRDPVALSRSRGTQRQARLSRETKTRHADPTSLLVSSGQVARGSVAALGPTYSLIIPPVLSE